MTQSNINNTEKNITTSPGSVEIRGLRFSYPDSDALLTGIDLSINPGEWCIISGDSGSGKTTLAMALNGLVPHSTGGHIGGEVLISGKDPRKLGPAEMSRQIGFLFQETASSFIGSTIEREIAFGLEQRGTPPREIENEINRVLSLTETEKFRFRAPHTLSGGERQRCALAAVLALRPEVLVLDEPTAQLDPASKKQIISLVNNIRKKENTTIIWIEQISPSTTLLADKIFSLNKGTLIPYTSPSKTSSFSEKEISKESALTKENSLLYIDSLSFQFSEEKPLLKNINLSIGRGELIFLKGINGSGKTTLFRLIMGLEKPAQGDILFENKSILPLSTPERAAGIAYLMQEPDRQLFSSTVKEELMSGILYHSGRKASYPENYFKQNKINKKKSVKNEKLKRKKITKSQWKEIVQMAKQKAQETAAVAELSPFWETPPQQLSYGFRKKTALAAVTAINPSLYLLDEPTVALDSKGREWLKRRISSQLKEGISFIVISHDDFFINETAGRIIEMEAVNGK